MDSLKDWASVLQWLKQPFFAPASMIVLSILLLSSELLDWLGLSSFRRVVSILFIISLCVLLSQLIAAVWALIRQWKRNRSGVTNRRKRLHQLTHDEKFILKGYIDGQTRTQNLDRLNGITIGLEDAGIIYRASDITPYTYNGSIIFPYNITDFAWDYLNEYASILTDL